MIDRDKIRSLCDGGFLLYHDEKTIIVENSDKKIIVYNTDNLDKPMLYDDIKKECGIEEESDQ